MIGDTENDRNNISSLRIEHYQARLRHNFKCKLSLPCRQPIAVIVKQPAALSRSTMSARMLGISCDHFVRSPIETSGYS
jgi:hypothetical protein